MPYGQRKRYGGRRRRKYLSKSYVKSKKGAKSQSNQILSLQRQIKSLSVKVNDRTQYSQFQAANNQEIIGHGAAPNTLWQPAVFVPTQPNFWTPIFQSETVADNNYGNKIRGRSIGFEHMIQLNPPVAEVGSLDPVTCTLMCVALRKETAVQVIQETNNLTDFTQGNRSYVLSTMGTAQGAGMCFINKGYFKVRYLKRFMIGGYTDFVEETKTTNLRDNNRRIYCKLRYNNLYKSANGSESWKDLTPEKLEPTDHLIWLLFHNAYGTQTISWHTNMVYTGRETN